MAVVKADGFGHGAVDVARTALANGATRLGVTSLDEALSLREAGLTAPVLSWLNPVDADFAAAVAADVDVAVPGREHLEAIVAHGAGCARPPAARHRHGARRCRTPGVGRPVPRGPAGRAPRRLVRVVGVMGHLANADAPADPSNALGRTRFEWGLQTARAVGLRPVDRHLAATAATLTDPRSHHTMSRVGAGLVGIDPSRTTRLRARPAPDRTVGRASGE